MNSKKSLWPVLLLCALARVAWADPVTQSAQAVQQGGMASAHASGSAAHAIAASGQVTSGVVAVPLASGGVLATGVGSASTAVAKDSARAANLPLAISDETVTVMPPPNEALQPKTRP